MTEQIRHWYAAYIALESAVLSEGGTPLRPHLRELEASLCAALARQGGRAKLDENLTITVEHMHIAGKHVATWFTIKGPFRHYRPERLALDFLVASNTTLASRFTPAMWKRGLSLPADTAAVAQRSKKSA